MGFGLKNKGVYWYFKDSGQTKNEPPHIWYRGLF